MSTRHRVERGALTCAAVALGVVFGFLMVSSAGIAVRDTWLVISLWGTGLAALLCGYAACRVDGDAGDKPEYFASLGRGLRNEWHRDRAA